MKKVLYTALLLTVGANAQQTITSVSDGNASNPLVWDCLCIPQFNDDIIINHNIVMNADWIVNNGGSITVNSNGTLIEDANYRSVLFDGTGTEFHNYGTTELTNIGFTGGALGMNHNELSIDTSLGVGANSTFMNMLNLYDLDSILIDGTLNNTGSIVSGDILNNGTYMQDGSITVDSLYNTGTWTVNSGPVNCTAIANTGSFTISSSGAAWMDVIGSFYNAGTFTLDTGHDLHIGGDFWNGDTLGGTATMTNNGIVEVFNDFYNGDNMDGSGSYCIGGNSWNNGNVTGTQDICDNGSGFDTNTGTIAGTITFCSSPCAVGINESEFNISVYPNPTSGQLLIKGADNQPFQLVTITGQTVVSGTLYGSLDISNLSSGMYFLVIDNLKHNSIRIIKN